MQLIDLFSGIGGFSLAASWIEGWHTVLFCEKDKFCQKVLTKNFPDITIFDDIKTLTYEQIKQTISQADDVILTAGFPCQPFSVAGKQRGYSDDRYLWPETIRIIREVKPAWVVVENVPGIINMALDQVLIDLEGENYACQTFIIPAASVGAWHKRNRIWLIAHSDSKRWNNEQKENRQFISDEKRNTEITQQIWNEQQCGSGKSDIIPYSDSQRRCGRQTLFKNAENVRKPSIDTFTRQWDTEPGVCGVANGVSNRVDRLKGLGNAIVPQIAYEIFKIIDSYAKEAHNL